MEPQVALAAELLIDARSSLNTPVDERGVALADGVQVRLL